MSSNQNREKKKSVKGGNNLPKNQKLNPTQTHSKIKKKLKTGNI